MVETRLLATVLGGLISGATGIAVAYYQFSRQKIIHRNRWLSELQSILQLYEEAWPPDLNSDEKLEGPTIRDATEPSDRELMYVRADQLSARLQSHLINSPSEIESDLLENVNMILQLSHEVRRGWDDYGEAGASQTSSVVEDYRQVIKKINQIKRESELRKRGSGRIQSVLEGTSAFITRFR